MIHQKDVFMHRWLNKLNRDKWHQRVFEKPIRSVMLFWPLLVGVSSAPAVEYLSTAGAELFGWVRKGIRHIFCKREVLIK